ncbi:acyl-CoA reductase [Poritiphilus flavus]|uniref:Acyl-CoA reductase n=1 Tax=Poritiphilus flavus TaxID=2697053 RepID=A0A6L9EGZ6_9FLAO|nr:acyl-CoA reductase [Poritiphilus flavus]NAS13529.1 acyl-CoA reductase [Poritiphilus flavus]
MGDQQLRIQAFVKLGELFREFCEYDNGKSEKAWDSNSRFEEFDRKLALAEAKNGWFTRENVLFSLKRWTELLNQDSLEGWLAPYDISSNKEKAVAMITAGNIPLVGFHDLMCILLTGNKAQIKLSSNANVLMPFVVDQLLSFETSLEGKVKFTEGKLDDFEAVIATGSNNTARYFEYYFGNQPNIIRKNRNSVAILSGNEEPKQLSDLGEDIFRYYGLGCRSVSKLFVPRNYDFDHFFQGIFQYSDIIDGQKYANNYDYNKAVYLMSEFSILDNGFLMLKEDQGYSSPIATLFYEYYDSSSELEDRLESDKDQLQCVVRDSLHDSDVPFGRTQHPKLDDYADGVDTVEFLLKT